MSSDYLDSILKSVPIRESVLELAFDALSLPEGSRGLDVACGAGFQSLLLAGALGPEGHVTGLDISPEFIRAGEELAEGAGMADRVSFKEGDASSVAFPNSSFDWSLSVDFVGYAPMEAALLLGEMKRVTRAGGTVAILAWSSERLLPGYPLLEAKLGTTTPGLAPFSDGMDPARHFQRGLGLLRQVGLVDRKARAFSGSVQAPLTKEARSAMGSLFEMRWPDAEKELSVADRAEFERLTHPDSEDFILNHEDYFAYFTYSMFFGTVR